MLIFLIILSVIFSGVPSNICNLAVSNSGFALEYVIPELMTEEICKLAVSNNGYALEYVIPELMTDEICKLAVSNHGFALQFVNPDEINEMLKGVGDPVSSLIEQ